MRNLIHVAAERRYFPSWTAITQKLNYFSLDVGWHWLWKFLFSVIISDFKTRKSFQILSIEVVEWKGVRSGKREIGEKRR